MPRRPPSIDLRPGTRVRPLRPPALTVALVLAACGHRTPAATSTPGTVTTATPAPVSVPPGHGARVFVDISESIRGFTSPTSVSLETLHGQVIDGALSAQQLNAPYQRCTVDEALHCAAPNVTAQQLRLPATYRGGSAALERVLRRPPRAPRPDLQEPDPLDPWAVTVLVTDGFQSSPSGFQGNVSDDVACTAGADPSCLAAALHRRVDEGYGVWVLRLVMPFDGKYFAEHRLDQGMWARVQAHVTELNRAPEWNGVHFAAREPNFTGDSGAFRWSGARLLLVFVLSRDLPRARALVAEMQQRLAAERFTLRRNTGDVAASEWAPFEGLTATVTSAARMDNGGPADEIRVDRPGREGATFVIPARCSIHGKARIRLDGAVAFGAIPPPSFARIDLGWRLLSPPRSEILVPREPLHPTPGPFAVATGMDCTVLAAGDYSYDLGLGARWTVDDGSLASEWFARESADTSYEMPERVYGLADLSRAVITAGVSREGVLDRVQLRVHRE